tara:strand:- start:867 stop:1127 length:261 start_codon:yes stop_codon:yes gene_type:complete
MKRPTSVADRDKLNHVNDLKLPVFSENLESILSKGKSLSIEGTNVVRVPFGVRRPAKKRPERPDSWATLVLPLNPLGSPTPPPQAA